MKANEACLVNSLETSWQRIMGNHDCMGRFGVVSLLAQMGRSQEQALRSLAPEVKRASLFPSRWSHPLPEPGGGARILGKVWPWIFYRFYFSGS